MSSISEMLTVISLKCPIGQKRIEKPVKGKNCSHIEPFDKDNFIEKCSTQNYCPCPICAKPIKLEYLIDDVFFNEILKVISKEFNFVLIKEDGSYEPYVYKNEEKKKRRRREIGQELNDIIWIKEEQTEYLNNSLNKISSIVRSAMISAKRFKILNIEEEYLQRINSKRKQILEEKEISFDLTINKFIVSKNHYILFEIFSEDEEMILYEITRESNLFSYRYGPEETDPGHEIEPFLKTAPTRDEIDIFLRDRYVI